MADGGHVNEKTAGQSDVAGDARALFPERFLGDLHDDLLAGFQHLGDQLRAPRRLLLSVVGVARRTVGAALLPSATHRALETRALRFGHASVLGRLARPGRRLAIPGLVLLALGRLAAKLCALFPRQIGAPLAAGVARHFAPVQFFRLPGFLRGGQEFFRIGSFFRK